MMEFTPQERAILRIVQADLPDSLTPYADIAASAGVVGPDRPDGPVGIEGGVSEAQVLALITRLRDEGVIRRFGASIKHQKTGWNANMMVAWVADVAQADAYGQTAAAHAHVSHCYFRPSSAADWPYTLYTMIHGHTRAECEAVVQELRAQGLPETYAMLDSIRELKKTSMTYFT